MYERLPISMPASTRTLRSFLRVALVLLMIGVGIRWLLDVGALLIAPRSGYDFNIYYTAALALRANPVANIYDVHVLVAVAHAHHIPLTSSSAYVYPPVLAVSLIPLTFLPISAAFVLWSLLNLVLLLVCALLVANMLRMLLSTAEHAQPALTDESSRRDVHLLVYALIVFMVLSYEPMREGIVLGQVNVIICFLVLLAIWVGQRKRERLAGISLAVAVGLKVYPAVLGIYYLLSGRRRLVASALVTGVVMGLVLVATIGVRGLLMTSGFLSSGSFMASQYHNEALARAPLWLAVEFGVQPGRVTDVFGYLLIGAVAVIFVAGLIVAKRQSSWGPAAAQLENAPSGLFAALWALCTMVLVAPLAWEHHYTWVLPACVVGFGYTLYGALLSPDEHTDVRLAVLFALGYMLTMPDLPLGYDGDIHFDIGPFVGGHPVRPVLMLMRPLGALLVWIAMGILYWHMSRSRGVASSLPGPADGPAPGEVEPIGDMATMTRRIGAVMLSFLMAVAMMRTLLLLVPTLA